MPSNRNSPQTQTSLLDEQDLDRQLVVASTKRRKTTQRTPANRVNKGKERAVTTDQEVLGPQASILILPNEVLLSIIEYTNPTAKTLCGLGKTCKRLNNLVSMDLFWRPIVATMYKPYTICLSESALPPSSSFSSTAAPSFSSSFSSSSASSSSLSLLFPLSSVTAISSSSAAPVFFGAAPNTGCRQFLADLAASMFCFRCGDGAETSLHVGLVDAKEMAERFKRRYCRVCQQSIFINKTNAKTQFLVTDKQLSRAQYIKKPWYGKGSYLYLKSTIESLSMERWGTKDKLNQEKAKRDPWIRYLRQPHLISSFNDLFALDDDVFLDDSMVWSDEDDDRVVWDLECEWEELLWSV